MYLTILFRQYNNTYSMRTFRSLSLLSSSSQYFKPKFPNKKTFCPHFARCGLASLAPVTCRAAVVYGQGKPLQVEFAHTSNSFDLPVNNKFSQVEQVEVSPPGPGEVKHLQRLLSMPDTRPVGASSPRFCFNMPH